MDWFLSVLELIDDVARDAVDGHARKGGRTPLERGLAPVHLVDPDGIGAEFEPGAGGAVDIGSYRVAL